MSISIPILFSFLQTDTDKKKTDLGITIPIAKKLLDSDTNTETTTLLFEKLRYELKIISAF